MSYPQETPSSPPPQLCANGCGFYGTKEYKNLCSLCFIKTISEKLVTLKIEEETSSLPRKEKDDVVDNGVVSTHEKVKCKYCNKKIRELMVFECRCGGKFCKKHRHAEDHSCNFDYKKLGRLQIAMENLVIIGDKLDERI